MPSSQTTNQQTPPTKLVVLKYTLLFGNSRDKEITPRNRLNDFNVLADERAAVGRFPHEFPKSKVYFSLALPSDVFGIAVMMP